MDSISTDILIVGGGIAGYAAALTLKNSPFKIILIEPRSKMDILNRGDVLYPNTIKVLNQFGLMQRAEQKGAIKLNYINAISVDKEVIRLNFQDIDNEIPFFYSLDHNLIEQTFKELAATSNLKIIEGVMAKDIVEEANLINVIVTDKSKDFEIKAKLVIAADGRNSLIRNKLHIPDQHHIQWEDSVTSFMNLKAEMTKGVTLFINPPRGILTQLLPNNRLRVAIHVPHGEGTNFLKQSTEKKYKYLLEFSELFQNVNPEFFNEHIYPTRSRIAKSYHKNNVALVGDSAHEVHPLSSQGISMAVMDAYVLSKILENSLENLEEKFSRYQAIRKPISQNVIEHSDIMATLVNANFPGIREIENSIIQIVEKVKPIQEVLGTILKEYEYREI